MVINPEMTIAKLLVMRPDPLFIRSAVMKRRLRRDSGELGGKEPQDDQAAKAHPIASRTRGSLSFHTHRL